MFSSSSPILNNWSLPRYALAGASLRSKFLPVRFRTPSSSSSSSASSSSPSDIKAALERTLRTHRVSERRQRGCHFLFFLSFATWKRSAERTRSPSESVFQRASGEDTVGRLVALSPLSPLSSLSSLPFPLSLYSSERGRRWGSHPPQHTATSHSASHYAWAADQEIVWFPTV